jgi:hypothetical protein
LITGKIASHRILFSCQRCAARKQQACTFLVRNPIVAMYKDFGFAQKQQLSTALHRGAH